MEKGTYFHEINGLKSSVKRPLMEPHQHCVASCDEQVLAWFSIDLALHLCPVLTGLHGKQEKHLFIY